MSGKNATVPGHFPDKLARRRRLHLAIIHFELHLYE